MRRLSALALSICLLSAQQPDSTPTFKASSNLVIVSAFVRDSKGAPVAGLKKEDFTVVENGKPQAIAVFEYQQLGNEPLPEIAPALLTRPAPPQPAPAQQPEPPSPALYRDRRLLVLYFDFAGMQPADQVRTQKSALDFVSRSLTASDLVSIMSFTSRLRTDLEFTADRDKLIAAIRKYRLGVGDDSLTGFVSDPGLEETDVEPAQSDVDAEFDLFNTDRKLAALEAAAKSLAQLPEKKALIYFSSGSGSMGVENQSQLRSTVNAAVRSNVSFYAVDVRGLQPLVPGGDASQAGQRGTGIFSGQSQRGQRDKLYEQQDTLYALAADTGGKALLDSNDIVAGITQAQRDLQSYYILGYYSTNETRDGRFRQVRVKLAGYPQARLDYRQGYYGAKEFKAFNSSDRERQLEEALALGDPVTEIPIALEVNYFRVNPSRYFVPVAVKVPGSVLPLARKGAAETTELDFIGQVRDAKGGAAASVRDAIRIKLPAGEADELRRKSILYDTGFAIPPGTYSLKLLVRENQTGKIGTFETKFAVPSPAGKTGTLPVSSVVWASQREPVASAIGSAEKSRKLMEQHPLVDQGQKLIPSITRVFRPNQSLFVYMEAYDAQTGPESKSASVAATVSFFSAKHKVLESDPVRIAEASGTRPGVYPLRLQVPLEKLKAGRYTCQVNVIDERGRKFAFERAALVLLPEQPQESATAPAR
jgi:VWFA-related protein